MHSTFEGYAFFAYYMQIMHTIYGLFINCWYISIKNNSQINSIL